MAKYIERADRDTATFRSVLSDSLMLVSTAIETANLTVDVVHRAACAADEVSASWLDEVVAERKAAQAETMARIARLQAQHARDAAGTPDLSHIPQLVTAK